MERPNIVLIMADDLGFSDIGCYGGEIKTPNLDGLAANGLRFTQFYNTARCWPTRAALLTGYYAQQVRRDTLPGIPSGGRGKRPAWAPLLSQMLKPLGYRSYHSGKWHIDGMPIENGFDRSYYLKDQGRFFNPNVHWEDDVKLPPIKPASGYYGTTAIADHAVKCLKEHADEHSDRPFFHYLAFTAPHFPLHALPADIAKYRDTYRRDWEQVRRERWMRLKSAGIIRSELSAVERDLGPPYHFPEALKTLGSGEVNRPLPWEGLTAEQQAFQADKMAIHAAMVDRIDQELGRVLDQLRAMDVYDNTLVFFLSDNGASAEIMVRSDGHDPAAAPGSAASYLCLGPGWSTTCNAPFRRHKTWVHEGGISTPLVVHWPKGISSRDELQHTVGHVIDIVPTILEVAGADDTSRPSDPRVPSRPGRSLVKAFASNEAVTREYLWWLHEGNRAIRVGDWKLVAAKDDPWELYNLANDRSETTNLAAAHAGKVQELSSQWQERFDEWTRIATQDPVSQTRGE
ncbi:MAG: arylsulfatase [Planctomycetaceae bacterium]|nr:arylsulfatase [Planctomycetaceae bacterium]